MPRGQPRIHITTLGSSAMRDIARLGGYGRMLRLACEGVGERFHVTANRQLICCERVEPCGDRNDDAARARELNMLLADETVAALVTLRGGAWFTRLLDRIDFDVLTRRRRPLFLFGFSEMSTLVAVAGQYPRVIGIYDLGPGFLYAGAGHYAREHINQLTRGIELSRKQRKGFAAGWALARFPEDFRDFFRDVADIAGGAGSRRVPRGRLVAGTLPNSSQITITGGTISVILPLIGSPYAGAIDTTGKWLALEDINEAPDPIDRMMAGLKLSGLFDRAEGIIMGQFLDRGVRVTDTVLKLLAHYLPRRKRTPIVVLDNFGHIYPMAPLVLHRPVTLRKTRGQRVEIDTPWEEFKAQNSK